MMATLSILSGCKKDELIKPESPDVFTSRHSVTIRESQDYFQEKAYSSRSNFTVNQSDWAGLEPVWGAAHEVELNDLSTVVMVPIADSAIVVNPYLDAYVVFFEDSLEDIQMHVLFFQADTTQYAQDSFPSIANFSGLIWEFYDEEDTYKITVVEDGIISGCGCSSTFRDYIDNIDSLSIMPRTQRPECPRFKDNIWERVGTAAGNIWKGIVKFFRSIVQNGGSGNVSGSGTSNGSSGTGGSNGTGGSSGTGGNGFDGFDGFGFGGHGGGGGGSAVILNLSSIYTEWQLKLMQKAAIWMNDTYGIDYSLNELYFLMGADCTIEVGDFLQNPPAHPPIDEEFTGPVCANEFAIAYILGLFPWLTEDDETEIEFLLYNVEDREKLVSYTAGDEERTKKNMKGYIKLKNLDSAYRVDRFVEMWNLLEIDPNALLIDCIGEDEEFEPEFWSELATFTPSIAVKNKIVSDGYSLQLIENAQAARVNLDFYFIEIHLMPKKSNGQRMTNEELISYFRLHVNEFTDFDPILGSTFDPIPDDQVLWNSSNPTGSIIKIDIPGDNGVVACSDFSSCCWIFSTIKENFLGSGYHPVSGNRQFGIAENGGNKYFYLKGADRATTYWDNFISPIVYGGTDQLWNNVIIRFNNYITAVSQGGSTTIGEPTRFRPNWNAVKQQLKLPQMINHINCE